MDPNNYHAYYNAYEYPQNCNSHLANDVGEDLAGLDMNDFENHASGPPRGIGSAPIYQQTDNNTFVNVPYRNNPAAYATSDFGFGSSLEIANAPLANNVNDFAYDHAITSLQNEATPWTETPTSTVRYEVGSRQYYGNDPCFPSNYQRNYNDHNILSNSSQTTIIQGLEQSNHYSFGNVPALASYHLQNNQQSAMRKKSTKISRCIPVSLPAEFNEQENVKDIENRSTNDGIRRISNADESSSFQHIKNDLPPIGNTTQMNPQVNTAIEVEEIDVEFNECIQKILDRVSEIESTSANSFSTPLHPKELQDLSYLCISALQNQQDQNRTGDLNVNVNVHPTSCLSKKRSKVTKEKGTNRNKQNTVHHASQKNQMLLLENIEADAILSLVELLDKHIRAAMNVHIFENAIQTLQMEGHSSKTTKNLSNRRKSSSTESQHFDQWLSPGGDGNQKLLVLRMGLEAASIVMFFACCQVESNESTSSACVNEDAMEASIALFRYHLSKHLIPAFNQTGHVVQIQAPTAASISPETPKKKRKSTSGRVTKKRRRTSSANAEDDENDNEASDTPCFQDSPSFSSTPLSTTNPRSDVKPYPNLLRDMKKLYRLLHDITMKLFLLLIERTNMVVDLVPLEDQQILLLANGSISAMEIDCYTASSITGSILTSITTTESTVEVVTSNLSLNSSKSPLFNTTTSLPQQTQISCIFLLSAIFRKYKKHRDIIIEDIFPVISNLPSFKRSLRAFSVQYLSAIAPSMLRDLNAHISSFTGLQAHEQTHCIQMMTALIVSLVHSCTIRPTYNLPRKTPTSKTQSNEEDSKPEGSIKVKAESLFVQSGIGDCWLIADSIVAELLQRSTVGKGDTSSEFRPFLINFVEDLLSIVIIPEYPGSEMLLLSLQRRLNNDIVQAAAIGTSSYKKTGQSQAPIETTYINLAFDLLGRINSFQAKVFAIQRSKPLKVNTMVAKPKSTRKGRPDEVELSDYGDLCNREKVVLAATNAITVRCDSCHIFYYGSTIGIPNTSFQPDEWYCDSCRLGEITRRESKRMAPVGHTNGGIVDDKYVMNLAFLTCLSYRWSTADLNDSMHFHLARWIDDIGQYQNGDINPEHAIKQKKKVICALLENYDEPFRYSAGSSGEPFTEEGSTRLILAHVTQSSSWLRSFRPQISFFLKLMASEETYFRKASLKVMERIVSIEDGDPELMLSSIVTKAISYRLCDESISVREAALALVGSYVMYSPASIDIFNSSLLNCLNDVGVSVRKRCIKIYQAILCSSAATDSTLTINFTGRNVVCLKMLQLASDAKEEDSIRDSIYELFLQLWLTKGYEIVSLESLSNAPTCIEEPYTSNSIVPDNAGSLNSSEYAETNIRNAKPRNNRRRSDLAAEQMMEVVRAAGTGEFLFDLLNELLGKVDAEEKVYVDGNDSNAKNRRKSSTNMSSSSATITASKRRAKVRIADEKEQQQCIQSLVDSLFELLITIEERRPCEASNLKIVHVAEESVGQNIAATLQTIDIFARIAPMSILQHIDTLLPYLKADNGVSVEEESVIVCATCDILYRITTTLSLSTPANDNETKQTKYSLMSAVAGRLGYSEAVANDIVQITYKFGSTTLNSAIRTLSVLASIHSTEKNSPDYDKESSDFSGGNVFGSKLLSLGRTFYTFLYKKDVIENFDQTTFKIQSGTHRGLSVLGWICQYHDDSLSSETWENEVETPLPKLVSPKNLNWSNLSIACYRIFAKFLSKSDSSTKCKAMEAFGGLFLAQPRLVLHLDKIGLVSDVMSDKAVLPLQLESLDCWKKILVSEEKRIDGGEARAKMNSDGGITVSKKISGDQDGDATLFGGVLTNHARRLFEMTHSVYPELRFSSLELVGLLLRQGLVNPNEAVPHLFALQGDVENLEIRIHALQLLMTEGEKRPDILRQRICAGVKQAYYLQRFIYHDRTDVSAVIAVKRGGKQYLEYDCIFSSVFKECIARNRKQRHGLYKNLLGLFETEDRSSGYVLQPIGKTTRKQPVVGQPRDIALLSFVAQVLAHLPYSTADDPLFIVYHLTSVVALQGPLCLDRLANFLRPHGLASDDALDENNLVEDALERAADSKFPSRTNEAQPLISKNFNLEEFIGLCRDGFCLCILLRLKAFLCSFYNLSLTRCMEYDPNAKERIKDKTALRAAITKPFDTSFASVVNVASSQVDSVRSTNVVDKDTLIRQYAEFRRRMREEQSCDPDDVDDDVASDAERSDSEDNDENVNTSNTGAGNPEKIAKQSNDTDNDSDNSEGEAERAAVRVAKNGRKPKKRGRKSKV